MTINVDMKSSTQTVDICYVSLVSTTIQLVVISICKIELAKYGLTHLTILSKQA